MEKPIRIGISSCLLGAKVRFDGGDKEDRFLTQTLGQYVEWSPVCPEVEAGLGIPRPAIRLEKKQGEIAAVFPQNGKDITAPLTRAAQKLVREMKEADLDGFILKKGSPSCGMERVRVYDHNGAPSQADSGVFAKILMEALPLLPVEEEGRLSDPRIRENWIERVFAYASLKELMRSRPRAGDFVTFHTRHKMTLLAHSPVHYKKLGALVAAGKKYSAKEFASRYESLFMEALKKIASPGRHTNVLQHMAGYLKTQLDAESKKELDAVIQDYRKSLVPLIVPVTLLAHYVRIHKVSYLRDQTYLSPHPKELALRSHV